MTKYSNEFKVKANKMVLKGNSISHVAKILNTVSYTHLDILLHGKILI